MTRPCRPVCVRKTAALRSSAELAGRTAPDSKPVLGLLRLDVISCNYLTNVLEVIDLAKSTKVGHPRVFICVGGHSASFTARAIVHDSEGAIDCVLNSEGEVGFVKLLDAIAGDSGALAKVLGTVTADAEGSTPSFVHSLDDLSPAGRFAKPPAEIFHCLARSERAPPLSGRA